MSNSDWIQHVRNLVEPNIWDKISEMYKIKKSVIPDLCTKSHPLPHHKLSLLMTLLCTGKSSFRNVLLALDTIYQQIILNTKKTSFKLGVILPYDRVSSF